MQRFKRDLKEVSADKILYFKWSESRLASDFQPDTGEADFVSIPRGNSIDLRFYGSVDL